MAGKPSHGMFASGTALLTLGSPGRLTRGAGGAGQAADGQLDHPGLGCKQQQEQQEQQKQQEQQQATAAAIMADTAA